jgi:hypothetical protein
MAGVNFNNITYSVKRFTRKVKNVFRWLPTIWKDEDYDCHFINEIFIRKLEHTRDFFLSGKTNIGESDKVAGFGGSAGTVRGAVCPRAEPGEGTFRGFGLGGETIGERGRYT